MKLRLVCIAMLIVASPAFARFPMEDEVRAALKPGMTSDEVMALYGMPGGASSTEDTSGARVLTYLSPFNSWTRDAEGYVGFKVTFRHGRLVDWRPITNAPSYDPDLHTREHLLPFAWEWGLILVAVFIWGVFKAFQFAKSEDRRIVEAYCERTIPTPRLPPDFRFIDHDTILQDVLERVGEPSRVVKLPVKADAAGYGTVETESGLPAIVTFEFDMPYRAAVVLMPEYPFQPESRIRAAYYRPPRLDEE